MGEISGQTAGLSVRPAIYAFITTWFSVPFLADFLSLRLQFALINPDILRAIYAEDGMTLMQAKAQLISGWGAGFGLFAVPLLLLLFLLPLVLLMRSSQIMAQGCFVIFPVLWGYDIIGQGQSEQQSSNIFWGMLIALIPLVFIFIYSVLKRIKNV